MALTLTGCFWNGGNNDVPGGATGGYDDTSQLYFAFPSDWIKINPETDSGNVIAGYVAKNPSAGGGFGNLFIL